MKLFHISDLHFGNHKHELIAPFLEDVKSIKPEVIIVSGDLTQRGKQSQYKMLRNFLQQINSEILLVPGNHDITLYKIWQRLLYPFKNYKHCLNENLPSTFQNDRVRIMGVNSALPHRIIRGSISTSVMREIEKYFSQEFSGINILFFHHNFDYREGWHKPLCNFVEFLEFIKESPIDLICTGHLHYSHISKIRKNSGRYCINIHAGTLLCPRSKENLNSYYAIELDNKTCTTYWRIFDGTDFKTESIEETAFIDS